MVRSPKSGVNFFSLGDFEEQLEMASTRAQPAILQVSWAHALLLSRPAQWALPARQGTCSCEEGLPAPSGICLEDAQKPDAADIGLLNINRRC